MNIQQGMTIRIPSIDWCLRNGYVKLKEGKYEFTPSIGEGTRIHSVKLEFFGKKIKLYDKIYYDSYHNKVAIYSWFFPKSIIQLPIICENDL